MILLVSDVLQVVHGGQKDLWQDWAAMCTAMASQGEMNPALFLCTVTHSISTAAHESYRCSSFNTCQF